MSFLILLFPQLNIDSFRNCNPLFLSFSRPHQPPLPTTLLSSKQFISTKLNWYIFLPNAAMEGSMKSTIATKISLWSMMCSTRYENLENKIRDKKYRISPNVGLVERCDESERKISRKMNQSGCEPLNLEKGCFGAFEPAVPKYMAKFCP